MYAHGETGPPFLIYGSEIVSATMEVQHTSHFVHVSRVVWLGLAFCWRLSRWTLPFIALAILSLNVLAFSPPALGLLPVFCKGDPLAVNTAEATNLHGVILNDWVTTLQQISTDLPPFCASEDLFGGLFPSQGFYNILGG